MQKGFASLFLFPGSGFFIAPLEPCLAITLKTRDKDTKMVSSQYSVHVSLKLAVARRYINKSGLQKLQLMFTTPGDLCKAEGCKK
jgi:hypothetical protein